MRLWRFRLLASSSAWASLSHLMMAEYSDGKYSPRQSRPARVVPQKIILPDDYGVALGRVLPYPKTQRSAGSKPREKPAGAETLQQALWKIEAADQSRDDANRDYCLAPMDWNRNRGGPPMNVGMVYDYVAALPTIGPKLESLIVLREFLSQLPESVALRHLSRRS